MVTRKSKPRPGGTAPQGEARPVLQVITTPEIERVLAQQMAELPRLALERAEGEVRPASVFGLAVCCIA